MNHTEISGNEAPTPLYKTLTLFVSGDFSKGATTQKTQSVMINVKPPLAVWVVLTCCILQFKRVGVLVRSLLDPHFLHMYV